jgi:pseudaminic acid cytidylyltransferase
MVSIDNEVIVLLDKQYSDKVPFIRSEAAADDFATTAKLLEELLRKHSMKAMRVVFNLLCTIDN